MDDLISRRVAIDRFQALSYDDWNQGVSTSWANAYSECAEVIRDLPAVDAVTVVRCRDCNEYQQNFHWCKLHDEEMQPNDFCSYGERREE